MAKTIHTDKMSLIVVALWPSIASTTACSMLFTDGILLMCSIDSTQVSVALLLRNNGGLNL